MQNLRFEEYGSTKDTPFVLRTKLERTDKICSKESNWHEDIEIEVCVDGEGEILLNGTKIPFSKGSVAVINTNVIHHTGTSSRLVYDCLIIKASFFKSFRINVEEINFESVFLSNSIVELIEKLKLALEKDELCKNARINLILLKLIIDLIENHSHKTNSMVQTKAFEKIKEVIKIIRKDYSKKINLESISLALHTDKYALCRLFKKATGQTVIQYLNNYRCQRAIELLKDGCTVSEAAFMCGFDSTSFFTKTFKSIIGTLPSSYKK